MKVKIEWILCMFSSMQYIIVRISFSRATLQNIIYSEAQILFLVGHLFLNPASVQNFSFSFFENVRGSSIMMAKWYLSCLAKNIVFIWIRILYEKSIFWRSLTSLHLPECCRKIRNFKCFNIVRYLGFNRTRNDSFFTHSYSPGMSTSLGMYPKYYVYWLFLFRTSRVIF